MVNVLKAYFGDSLHYSEHYTTPKLDLERCLQTNFQKTHDLGLQETIRRDRNYIVMVRDPIDFIQSWHEQREREVERGARKTNLPFDSFWDDSMAYYVGFTNKWMILDVRRRLIVRYERLLAMPLHVIGAAVRHITEEEPDWAKLSSVIDIEQKSHRAGGRIDFV